MKISFSSKIIVLVTVAAATQQASSVDAKHHASGITFAPKSHLTVPATSILEKKTAVLPEANTVNASPALQVRGGVANTVTNAVMGSIVMALIEKGVKEGFRATGVSFPSQLAGCLILFTFLLGTNAVTPNVAANIFDALGPGAALLGKPIGSQEVQAGPPNAT